MDDAGFDALVRRLDGAGSRRPLLGAGMAALAALGVSTSRPHDVVAKKKKKKKKKKGGGGGTTPPPSCPSGQKVCNASCIAVDACCATSDCPAGQSCTRGICACTGNTITCGDLCCDKASEICEMDGAITFCRAGACPSTSICASGDPGNPAYLCANSLSGSCVCTNTVDPTPEQACIDFEAVTSCGTTCSSSSQCPSGSVCIATGAICDCPGNFCAPRCGE